MVGERTPPRRGNSHSLQSFPFDVHLSSALEGFAGNDLAMENLLKCPALLDCIKGAAPLDSEAAPAGADSTSVEA